MGTWSLHDKLRWKRQAYNRQGGKCYWCQEKMRPVQIGLYGAADHPLFPTIEHLIPRYVDPDSPRDDARLWVLACRRCNNGRAHAHAQKVKRSRAEDAHAADQARAQSTALRKIIADGARPFTAPAEDPTDSAGGAK